MPAAFCDAFCSSVCAESSPSFCSRSWSSLSLAPSFFSSLPPSLQVFTSPLSVCRLHHSSRLFPTFQSDSLFLTSLRHILFLASNVRIIIRSLSPIIFAIFFLCYFLKPSLLISYFYSCICILAHLFSANMSTNSPLFLAPTPFPCTVPHPFFGGAHPLTLFLTPFLGGSSPLFGSSALFLNPSF